MPIDDKDISILPGDLNNVKRKKFRRRMTRDPARGVNAARVSAVRTLYEDDLDLNGTFRGIILKEVPENYETTSWIGDVVDFLGDAFFDQIKYYKVRVPEVHTHIPDPWSSDVDNECTLLLHPTFQTIKGQEEKYEPGQIVTVRFYSADGVYQPTILEDFGKKVTPPTKPIDRSSDAFVQALLGDTSGVNPVFGDSIGTGQKLDPITKLPTSNSPDSVKRGWRSKFGGAKWRIDLDGIEFKDEGRPFASERITEQIWEDYGRIILRASDTFKVPIDIIFAMIPIEALYRNGSYAPDSVGFEPIRPGDESAAERHWRAYERTREADRGRYFPHRVSPGLMQTLVTTARSVVRKYQSEFNVKPYQVTSPDASAYTSTTGRRQGFVFSDKSFTDAQGSTLFDPELSIFCGAGYMRMKIEDVGPEPVLLVGAYNAGSLRKTSKNKWKIRTYSPSRIPKFASYYNTFHRLVNNGVIILPDRARLSTIPSNQDITGVNVDITSE